MSGTTEATNINESGYAITISGKGNYSGTVNEYWAISEHIAEIKAAPAASAITYGQSLADSTLTGGSAVDQSGKAVSGTFAWSDDGIRPEVSDSNRTEYEAVFRVDDDTFAMVACKVKLKVNKAVPTVIAPVAKELIYNGYARELVTAGVVTGGTMRYAIGTDAVTAPASGWTASIPTGTAVGTYYVWYKAIGDADHSDSTPACGQSYGEGRQPDPDAEQYLPGYAVRRKT